jgi:hypothetical protein
MVAKVGVFGRLLLERMSIVVQALHLYMHAGGLACFENSMKQISPVAILQIIVCLILGHHTMLDKANPILQGLFDKPVTKRKNTKKKWIKGGILW